MILALEEEGDGVLAGWKSLSLEVLHLLHIVELEKV